MEGLCSSVNSLTKIGIKERKYLWRSAMDKNSLTGQKPFSADRTTERERIKILKHIIRRYAPEDKDGVRFNARSRYEPAVVKQIFKVI
jgi:hypothetical protein